MLTSDYIIQCRKNYSIYTIHNRALPSLADGLIASGRRIMWVAKDGRKWKSNELAGATTPYHPHANPETPLCTLAAKFNNNKPLLTGYGSFGTLLNPNAYGATRYTSVQASSFANEALYVDMDLVPMKPTSDHTKMEPVYFLPLVPLVFVNPNMGMAVGFACNILPRPLTDIIDSQIKWLKGTNERKQPMVYIEPLDQYATDREIQSDGKTRWFFRGTIKRQTTKRVAITSLPYGLTHEKAIDKINELYDQGILSKVEDNSAKEINIVCTFKKPVDKLTDDQLIDQLGLTKSVVETINMIDMNDDRVVQYDYHQVIQVFTEWRLQFYLERYKKLKQEVEQEIQRLKDIVTAIENDAGAKAAKIQSKKAFKDWLSQIGIVNLDYISSLPVYRFTKEEKKAVKDKIKDSEQTLKHYEQLISSEDKRKQIYIEELQNLKKKHGSK